MARITRIKSYSIGLVLGLTAGQLHAQKPDWISVMELVGKFNETDDLSYASNAMYRCSAMSLVWGSLLQRDGLDELSRVFLGDSAVAAARGYRFYSAKINQDYDESKSSNYIEEVQSSEMFEVLTKKYVDWMTENYVTFGDYTGDTDFREELTACKELVNKHQS